MSAIHGDLQEIADAAAIVGPDRYRLLDAERRIAPATEDAPETMLLRSLESEMYYRLYRRPDTPVANAATSSVDRMRGFTAALSSANCGAGTWDPGWRIAGEQDDGDLLLWRDGVRYRAAAAEVRRGPGPDDACRVWVPKEMRQLIRGFYMALGDAPWPETVTRPGTLLRLYWNLGADIAPLYLTEITRRLNARHVPFRTKVIQDPANYHGADSAVLYLPAGEIRLLWPELRAVYARLGARMRAPVPMFAHRLALGLGYAEDPGDGLSFGQARCRIAAAGLWRAFEAGDHGRAGRAAHLAAAFNDNGIDPQAPFRLRAGDCPPAPADFGDR